MRKRDPGIAGSARLLVAALLALACVAAAPLAASAAILFDGSPGTAAPPATLGPYTMTAFADDTRPVGVVGTVPAPPPVGGDLALAPGLDHNWIGVGWMTWSHGYTGDVYDAFGITNSVTLTLPAGTGAFYFYVEPEVWGFFNVTATGTSPVGPTSSGPISVNGNAGAGYFGFYTTLPDEEILTIVISVDPAAGGFAVGEFGIAPVFHALVPRMSCRAHSAVVRSNLDAVVYAGEQWLCDVTIFNLGDGDGGGFNAVDAAFDDTVPAGLTFVASTVAEASTEGAAGTCAATPLTGPGTVTCSGIDVPVGGSVAFQLAFAVAPEFVATSANGELPVTNQICVVGAMDPDIACATETDLVKELAELRISKFVQPTGPIHAGDVFEYTIWVDNYGPSVARDVLIRDTLLNGYAGPPENDRVSIQSCAFSVSQGGGAITQFTCTTGPVVGTQFGTDAGLFRTNQLWPQVVFDAGPPIVWNSPGRLRASFRLLATSGTTTINATTVGAPTPDPDPSNNMAEASLEILPAANLGVTLTASAEEQQVNQTGLIFNNAVFGQAFPTAPNYFASTRVTAGRRIQYTMTVTNTSTDPDGDPAENVVLSARLPAGVRIYQGSLTAPAGVSCETGTPGEPLDRLTCGVGRLAPAASASTSSAQITFQVLTDASLPAGTVLEADAHASSDTYDRVNGNDHAFVQNTVLAAADTAAFASSMGEVASFDAGLQRWVVTDTAGQVTPGHALRYQVTVQSSGASFSRSVTVRETLPPTAEVEYLSAEGASCRADAVQANVLYCALGDLAAGERRTFDVYVRVNAWATALTSSCARVLSGASNTSPPGPPPVPPGDPTATLTWDPLTTDNESCAAVTVVPGPASLTDADLQAFSVFGAEVQTNGLPGLAFDSNVVTPMPDPACCNFGGTTVTAGRRIQWDTSALNAGPAAAHNAWIEVLLPFGTSLIENTLTGSPTPGNVAGRCSAEDAGELRKKVVCRYGTLLSGQTGSLRFLVLVDPALPPGTQLSFDSRVGADEADPNESNNITSIQFDTNAWADQALDVADIPPAQLWSPGELNVFEVRVENRGPSLDRAAALRIDLPEEFVFERATAMYAGLVAAGPEIPGTLPCQVLSATQVLCPLGDLAVTTEPGLGAVPLRVFVSGRVLPGTPAPTTLTATVTGTGSTRDPFAANDAASEQVDTDAGAPAGTADLAITMAADPALQFSPGQEVTYALSVVNNGPAPAADVVVVDELPGAIVPTATDLGGGAGSCLVAGNITCTLGGVPSGGSRTILVRGYVKRRLASRARVANGASVASDTPDAVPENNYASAITLVRVHNIVNNPGFEDLPIAPPWQELLTDAGDGQDCVVAHDGSCSYRIVGAAGVEKRLRQDLVFNGKKGDLIEVAGFSQADGVSGSGAYRIELRAYLASGWRTFAAQSFAPGTHGWQKRVLSFTAPGNFRALAVVVKFKKTSGTAWFDDVRIKVYPGSTP